LNGSNWCNSGAEIQFGGRKIAKQIVDKKIYGRQLRIGPDGSKGVQRGLQEAVLEGVPNEK
jgi:hypothetical protein